VPRPSRSRTRLEPGVRREQILDAADTVFRDRAPGDVTFEAVAEAADVSRALLYNYFGDRKGLLAAIEVRALRRLDDALLAVLDPSLEPAQQLRPLANAYVEFSKAHGQTWRVLAATGATDHPSVHAARRTRVERLAALWGGTDAAKVAAHTVTLLLEAVTMDGLDGRIDTDAAVDVVCQILTDGLERAGVRT